MESHRAERVSEALREELEELIGYELTDPRLNTVYVTEVRVSSDKRLATVRIGTGGDQAAREETLKVLDGARNFLRRQLSQRLDLFRIPDLRFEADTSIPGNRVDQLLKRIRKGRPRDASESPAKEKNPSDET